MKNIVLPLVICLLAAVGFPTPSQAQQSGYKQTNLVANTPGMANHVDPQLSNSWGVAFFPGQPFWIADNNSGLSTLYDASGNKNSLVVQIPSAKVNPCSPGCPTGIVTNGSTDFGGALFLFDTAIATLSQQRKSGQSDHSSVAHLSVTAQPIRKRRENQSPAQQTKLLRLPRFLNGTPHAWRSSVFVLSLP